MRFLTLSISIVFFFSFLVDTLAKTDKYRVMWRDNPATTMTIGWNQISGSNPVVFYDTNDHGKEVLSYSYSIVPEAHNEARGMQNYFARLVQLLPGTVYYFVIQDSEGCSERMSFRTAPDHPYERLSIVAGGDSRNYREARQKANSLIPKLRPHCILFGGDMTGGDNAKQWRAWFDDWQLTISPEGHLTPVIITRGNHEYSNQTLVDLFDVATKDAYYALSIGGDLLRVYTLNSLIPTGGHQKAWLEQDLAASQDHRWRIAQYHYAIRPHTDKKSERNNQLRDWAPLFEKYKLKMAVESDAHCVKWTYPIRPSRAAGSDEGFIRDDEAGTVYVGEGCWGAPLRRNNDDKSWTRNSGSFNQFKWIFIDQDRIEVRTVQTDYAAEAMAVRPNDIFEVPEGLRLWKPSNGAVVNIDHQDLTAALAVSMVENQKEYLGENIQADADKVVVKGEAKLPAQVGVDHPVNYRHDQRTTREAVAVRAEEDQRVNTLVPIASGLVQAKYAVKKPANVEIRLVDQSQKVLTTSAYKNQNSGNYLQSIDMRPFPDGQYMLTIEANDELIQQYLVVK